MFNFISGSIAVLEHDHPNFGLEPMTNQEKETVQGLFNIKFCVIREEIDYYIK